MREVGARSPTPRRGNVRPWCTAASFPYDAPSALGAYTRSVPVDEWDFELAWPLGVYGALVIALAALIVAASYVLGERHHAPAKGAPYEGGIVSEGSARVRFSVEFYLVAVFFVIFDVEAVFVFGWAVAGRTLGWAAFVELVVFVAVLLAGLAYLWRSGGLDFAPRPPRRAGGERSR